MKALSAWSFAASLLSVFIFHHANAATEAVLYSFCSKSNCTDGEGSFAGLIDVNGTFYGTTTQGGAFGLGTVFAVDPKSGAETVVYSFDGGTGASPGASVIDVDGTLYGTTIGGGASGDGTVFALDPNTGAETILHSFSGGNDGDTPQTSLINVKGTLYGTTEFGGANNNAGTVYSLDRTTGAETILYSFCSQNNCTDGSLPSSRLIDVNGTVYGTTESGGASGLGTVFALDPDTGLETVLYSFCSQSNCTDGSFPQAGLIDVNGLLYGTTSSGGASGRWNCKRFSNCGVVFSISTTTGAETVVHSFCSRKECEDGAGPRAGLIDVNGKLYGTTIFGGNHKRGTVFSVDPATGAVTIPYSFCSQQHCADGRSPEAGLINVNGILYGTTSEGGLGSGCSKFGCGTVFSLTR